LNLEFSLITFSFYGFGDHGGLLPGAQSWDYPLKIKRPEKSGLFVKASEPLSLFHSKLYSYTNAAHG